MVCRSSLLWALTPKLTGHEYRRGIGAHEVLLAMSFYGTLAHINFLIERIAGHFVANPKPKGQLLVLLVDFDLGNNDALENATVNVDVARCPGILDKETLLLQNLVSTDGRKTSSRRPRWGSHTRTQGARYRSRAVP